ncbi:MAG: HAD family phosphatase [Candidatus Marinimicrobia bacterium]|nr:HAD family phosphatase [Candidatus Neomarinimicrobiota bacterium]
MTKGPEIGRLQAILFDFDGVVIQSEDVYDLATAKLGAFYQQQIPKSFFDANRGIAEDLFYERFKEAFDLEVDELELQQNGQRILWNEFSRSVNYTPGFEQFFTKIRKLVPYVALVTATPRPLLTEIFQNSNINTKFDQIVTASEVSRNKPAPDPYLQACRIFAVDPGSTLVIEDSPTGLRSATVAGCQTVGITTSCDRDSLKEANFVVDSFGELEELLTIV